MKRNPTQPLNLLGFLASTQPTKLPRLINMYELIYPTVDLFLYDLRDGLGQSDQKVAINRQKFWQKIDPAIDPTIIDLQTSKENPEKEFVKLHDQKFPEPYLDGRYFALQLGDTFFLQVDASDHTTKDAPTPEPDPPRSLSQLAKLKNLVINKLNHHEKATAIDPDKLGTLGQTWLVWGKATANNTTPDHLRSIAQACFPHLTPNQNWKSKFTEIETKIGELVGARVFEYTQTPKNWTADLTKFSQENYHLVILLFPDDEKISLPEIKQRMQRITFDLVKLFAYRHKIIWSYWNSRRLKAELKESAQQMEDLRKQIQAYQKHSFNLDRLQAKLTESLPMLAEYSTKLNQMSSQGHTIKINLENYQKRLTKIIKDQQNRKDKNGQSAPLSVDLAPFQEFVTLAEERYQQQISMDYEGLSSVLTILENLTRTIDTLVNIERTRAENRLNTTIAIAGLGLAASSSVAGIVATQVYQPENTQGDRLPVGVGFAYTVVISLAIVLVGVVGAIGFRQLFRRWR